MTGTYLLGHRGRLEVVLSTANARQGESRIYLLGEGGGQEEISLDKRNGETDAAAGKVGGATIKVSVWCVSSRAASWLHQNLKRSGWLSDD